MGLKGRTAVLRLMVIAALLVLVGRMFWVQVVLADEITARVEGMRLESRPILPTRGAIVDRSGRPLAVTVPSYSIIADPTQMKESAAVAAALAEQLGLDRTLLAARLTENSTVRYLPLHEGLSLQAKESLEALRLPGIYLELRRARAYPQGSLANHIIGYINADGAGEYGLEARYDKELAGVPGYVLAEFTHARIPIENLIKRQVPAVPGYNLVLTIDAPLQELVEAKLAAVIEARNAKRALVMAMDAYTGELLVMAMSPGAHPGDRSTWGDPVDFGLLNNWAVDPMPMGSIFKVITVAAALEERAISLESTFIDRGKVVIDGRSIFNWDSFVPIDPVPMTVAELMQKSSNVGLIEVGKRIPRESFVRYLQGFGFLDKTGIDLSLENSATLGDPFDQKRDIDWANMFIGQHIEVTPIQMLTAVAAIANGGKLVQPHLVREIREPDGTVVRTTPTVPRRQVISEATAREVQQIMVSVIEKGTGGAAKTLGYTVGGKTGTAEKYAAGQIKDRYIADFVGFAPASDPKIVMMVLVDEPEGEGYGGRVAAPIFAELMPYVMQAVQIAPDSKAARGEEQAPPKVVAGVVPAVQWLTVDRALARLSEGGFRGKVTGHGDLVAEQSPAPGSVAKPDSVVELKLIERTPDADMVRVPHFAGLSLAEATQLAVDIGLTLKPSGTGFVVDQSLDPGAEVKARSALNVRLAPRAPTHP